MTESIDPRPYIYAPIDAFGGKVLKCQGIATQASVMIVLEKHPEAIVLPRYMGDRIDAATYEAFEDLVFSPRASLPKRGA